MPIPTDDEPRQITQIARELEAIVADLADARRSDAQAISSIRRRLRRVAQILTRAAK